MSQAVRLAARKEARKAGQDPPGPPEPPEPAEKPGPPEPAEPAEPAEKPGPPEPPEPAEKPEKLEPGASVMGHESQPAHKLTKLPDGRILATNESEDCYFVLSPDGTRERVDIRTAAVLYNQARSQESKRPKGRSRGRGTAAADPDDGRRGQREGWPGTRGSQDPGAPGFAGDPGSLGDSGEFGDSGSPGVLGDPRRGGAFFSKEKEKGETLGAFVMMELRKEYEAMKERRRILGRERRARLKAEKERAKREAASPGSTEQEDSRPRLAKQSVKERAAILMARVAELEAQLEASRKAEEGKENKE